MKQLKPLKMFVPESDFVNGRFIWDYMISKLGNYQYKENDQYEITRADIHELVQAHAEKLGLSISEEYYEDEEYVYIYSDGHVYTSECNHEGFQEISTYDFLKLTPDDVEEKGLDQNEIDELLRKSHGKDNFVKGLQNMNKPELTQEEIDILTFKQPPITARNEKAWELFLSIAGNSYFANRYSLTDLREIALKETDEFLKHAGNK